MDVAALFFSLALLILVGMYLYAPLARRNARPISKEEHELSALMAERDRVINALQELDFDFKLGKIPSEDYPSQREALLQKGADILRTLDELVPSSTQVDTETRIERAIAARRAQRISADGKRVTQPVLVEDQLEAVISARRKSRRRKVGSCPNCGKPIMQADRFCPSCGKALN
jgi:hypothetical protein